MNTQGFYANLPALTKFPDLANPDNYVRVPDDWYILITDVVGSTRAIAQGRYKDVNTIGASSIIAVLNAVQPLDVPFVFGGDGATLLVPPSCLEVARTALIGVRAIARESFDMELRVGVVPVADVHKHCLLEVAKFRLSSGYCQASFIGGGITLATDLIKKQAVYRLDVPGSAALANLSGLECRWQEIPSERGHTLSIIVAALTSSGTSGYETYSDFLEMIQTIYGQPDAYHPISKRGLQLSFNPRQLKAEVKLRAASSSRWSQLKYLVRILAENLLGSIFMRFQLTMGGVDWGQYKDEVRVASDYQKIDDVLRMVISSDSSQTRQLIQYLEHCSQGKKLAYGVHISDRALLTCLILDRRSCHFHLVDGADGGYAEAAKDLKLQLRAKAKNWKTYAKLARHRTGLSKPHPQAPSFNGTTPKP